MVSRLDSRVRRIEAYRKPDAALFFMDWHRDGATDEERDLRLTECGIKGGDPVVSAMWSGDDMPASRWIATRDLSDAELDQLAFSVRGPILDQTSNDGNVAGRDLVLMSNEELALIAWGARYGGKHASAL